MNITLSEGEEHPKALLKIHGQFSHPGISLEENLLKNAILWVISISRELKSIHSKCLNCKQFSKVPPRLVVTLSPASELNEVLTLDLTEVKVKQFKYILHVIDGYTKLSPSLFITNKESSTIVVNLMKHWLC